MLTWFYMMCLRLLFTKCHKQPLNSPKTSCSVMKVERTLQVYLNWSILLWSQPTIFTYSFKYQLMHVIYTRLACFSNCENSRKLHCFFYLSFWYGIIHYCSPDWFRGNCSFERQGRSFESEPGKKRRNNRKFLFQRLTRGIKSKSTDWSTRSR